MAKSIKAIVRNIPVGTYAETDVHQDNFVFNMREIVGKSIKVVPMKVMNQDAPNWYEEAGKNGIGWAFHESWLSFE